MDKLNIEHLDQEIIRRLEQRAALHGCSVESELDSILKSALGQNTAESSVKDLLLSMPVVGEDADFEGTADSGRPIAL